MNIENFIEGKIEGIHGRKSAALLVMSFFFYKYFSKCRTSRGGRDSKRQHSPFVMSSIFVKEI